jgi:hypothetical protein
LDQRIIPAALFNPWAAIPEIERTAFELRFPEAALRAMEDADTGVRAGATTIRTSPYPASQSWISAKPVGLNGPSAGRLTVSPGLDTVVCSA